MMLRPHPPQWRRAGDPPDPQWPTTHRFSRGPSPRLCKGSWQGQVQLLLRTVGEVFRRALIQQIDEWLRSGFHWFSSTALDFECIYRDVEERVLRCRFLPKR